MENNHLQHHGVKGMKWGVRRYQNTDGSLTPAGKKRYDQDVSGLSDKQKKRYTTNPDKWVKEDLERSKKVVDEGVQLTNRLKNTNYVSGKGRSKTRMDLSKMTDAQMREKINREILERQYNDLFANSKKSKGREYVSNVLEVAGTVLGITGTSLGIALAIKDLKG